MAGFFIFVSMGIFSLDRLQKYSSESVRSLLPHPLSQGKITQICLVSHLSHVLQGKKKIAPVVKSLNER